MGCSLDSSTFRHDIRPLTSRDTKLIQFWIIVSPDESRGYLGFSMVTPLPQRFPFGRDNLKKYFS